VLLIEAHDFARRLPYHHHKLALVFAAMRQFRDRLRAAGYDVTYLKTDTFGEGLSTFFENNPDATLVTMRSPSYGSERRFRELVETVGGDVRFVENELFVSTRAAFAEWADGEQFRHENFYRWMRRETGVLMDGGEPLGGAWNYDEDNREFPPQDWESPPVPTHDYDDLTTETAAWVAEEFDTWGATDGFPWPVTRKQACEHLRHFVEHRLPAFGPYQDAMRGEDWAMAHALLSGAMNVGLVHPMEVIEAVEAAYHDRSAVSLASAEGCIRQLLGWREFMRHVYRHAMPELGTANQLGADRDLPEFYWSGETGMNCLAETVEDVHDRGYAHHIQRLMVLANFATLWGVEPQQLNEWFHATYVDAYHWVTTPNVVEMGQYAHGVFATKPYVSSANYVDRMSDYCADCPYDPSADTGEDACPFNALYWDFLGRNEGRLRSNHRMGLMYSHVDNKRESGDMDALRERVADLRELADDGDL
jgi:deoxyribodipyrimidine photolyase-related protein